MDSTEDREVLTIGDLVLFKDVGKQGSYLSVEGILLEDVVGNGTQGFLQDSIFCVHLQRQYSASRDLNAFLSNYGMDPKNVVDEGAKKYLQALERGRENEKNLNDNYMRKKHGQTVVFGDIIQLFHVSSGKYLTVIPDSLADDERDNIKVGLNVGGSPFSWFQVSPRYKIDKDGDRVMTYAEVYLKVAERGNEYIHLAERDPKPGYQREINCALEFTSWRLQIFQGSAFALDTKKILISQLVYLHDPESKCNLTIAETKVENLDAVHKDEEESEYFHEYGDIILTPGQEDIDSNLLWFIESSSMVKGGPIKCKSDQIRFKHLNSGMYLQQLTVMETLEDGSEVEKLILTKTNSCDTADTLFSVHEATTTNNKYLETSKAVQITGNGIWIRRGDIVEDDDSFSFMVRGFRDKSAAVSLIINTYSKANENGHQSDADSSSVSSKEPLDVFTGKAIRRHIQKYKEMTVVPRSDSVNTVWPNSIRTDMPFFNFVMDKSIYFSQGFPISAINVQLGVDKGNANVRPHRQNLLREQGSLEVVLQIIQTLTPVTDRSEIIKANSGNRKKKQPSDDEVAMISMGMAILKKCFELIYYNILDNPENQLYVADFMPVLLSHLNTQPLAGKCVTEMLSKNMELQETKIGTSDIQIFVEKLRSSKMNAMYLNLLQACCSCEGDGVDANQGKIATMIFSNTNDVIIQLNADHKKVTMVPWNQDNSIYLTPTPIPGSPIRGEPLISKGIPLLSLNWTTNSIDYSPLGLFGKLSVNVEELFKIVTGGDDLLKKSTSSGSKLLKSKKMAAATQKAAVASYFVAQMFLGAEMCLDRNYIAMHCLDNLFPYEVLITILKLDVRSDLKSAAARLMMTLHVDRDPQAKSKIPCLTRTWSDVKKNSDPQLPFVDPGRRYYFGLLQQLISEYVRQMAGSKWDELSEHMLKLLKTLVEFNFYGEISRMENVVAPLIMALDRRQVIYVDLVTAASTSTLKKGKEKDADGSPEKVLENVSNEEKQQDSEIPDAVSNETIEKDVGKLYDPIVGGFFSFFEFFNINNAAKVLLLEDSNDGSGIYTPPIRYSKAPLFELETMVLIVDILGFSQHVIEDRDISVLMRYFYLWDSGLDNRSPAELFEQSIIDSKTLTLGVADFDNVMIDVLMFVHTPLVQSTLEVLMAHHSKRSILLKNMNGVQLLASNKKERQFKMVDQMLQQLEQNAETQELWGELASEADYAVSKQTKDILKELTDLLRIPNFELDFDNDFSPNVPVQDLLRNLGCFNICLKVFGLLETIEEELDEKALNTQEVCRLCNDLLYWFFLKNPKNQELGFEELDLFLDSLDDDINSHLVVGAIFCDNEQLMVQIPRKHIVNMVDLIVKNGQSHHYLSLLLALPTIGEKNITENQIDIVMNLTSPGKFQKVASYFVPVNSPEYELKCELMEPYLAETTDINIEDLPPQLSYHLVLLHVLSRCTVGRLNVTAVEAKVQSIFLYKDILNAILDDRSNLLTKLYMSDFFFNAVMDVELSIPGLETSDSMWTLISSYTSFLVNAPADLQKAHELGWQSPDVCSQKIKLYIVGIRIIGAFFKAYFDPTQFKDTASTSKNKDQTSLLKSDVDKIITDLYDLVIEVHMVNSPRLSKQTKSYILQAAEHLKKSSPRLKEATIPILEPTTESYHSPDSKVDEHEEKIAKKFEIFLKEIEKDASVQYKADNEGVAFISLLEKLPFIADLAVADVRYEGLIKKLVFHIRENIKIVDNQKRMDSRITTTSRWIVKAFRTMIENRMGMSIHERDENGGEKQDNAAAPVVNALNTCGATALCLDLIAFGIDESLQLEAIKLGVGLLFKEGGALEVQALMNSHLRNSNSELFFKQVRLTVQKLQAWSSWNKTIILDDGAEPKPPDELLLLRFLQLMCEGHYLPNQDIMREQSHNAISYNLLDDFVSYLNCLSRIPCRTSTCAGIRLTALILEVIQGPCEGNQVHFALNTELVEALNRINRCKVIVDCLEEEEIEMKKTSIDIFQGLIEGQGEKSPLYDRILSIIHLDIIVMMSKNPSYCSVDENSVPTEEQLILQTECVVLLLSFCNFRPSLYDEIGISRRVEDIVGSGTAMIEVIWRSGIHRRFFHVPAVCDYLAKSSKDNLVENVDRSTAENKLVDFLNRSHDLYREVKHQQLLTEMKIASVFSRANIDRLTWVSFILVCTINGFFIADYNVHNPSSTPQISDWVKAVTFYLKIVLAVVSFLTILLWVVVRSPVIYKSYIAAKYSIYESILYSAIDGMTAYYVWFLVVSILAVVLADYYMSVLLLDIVVKDATTRAVLSAVVTPWKALAMGALLQAFVIYIYSFFTFWFFRHEFSQTSYVNMCDTMVSCLKFTLSYGFQNGGGIADTFNHDNGNRLILDLTFFCVVLVVLLNVVFGMIIDTFSSLRAERDRKYLDTINLCFICGIDKQVFDRTSDEPEGFKTHVKIEHNMWNYLYFIFLLWEQDKDDDDGLETYVRRAIAANEVVWFPANKAVRLQQLVSPADLMRKDLAEGINQMDVHLTSKFDEFQLEVSSMMYQLVDSIKHHAPQNLHAYFAESATSSEIQLEFHDDDDSMTAITDNGSYTNTGAIEFKVANIRDLNLNTTSLLSIRCDISVDGVVVARAKAAIVDKSGSITFVDRWVPIRRDVSSVEVMVVVGDAKDEQSIQVVVAKCSVNLESCWSAVIVEREDATITVDANLEDSNDPFVLTLNVRSVVDDVVIHDL